MTDRQSARRTVAAAFVLLVTGLVLFAVGPAAAQTRRTTSTTTTTTTQPALSVPVAPGQTAPNGGPLLGPGDTASSSAPPGDTTNQDRTGTIVALVISGLLVVALLLALLTYWFWRNTRPVRLDAASRAPSSRPIEPQDSENADHGR